MKQLPDNIKNGSIEKINSVKNFLQTNLTELKTSRTYLVNLKNNPLLSKDTFDMGEMLIDSLDQALLRVEECFDEQLESMNELILKRSEPYENV